LVGVRQPAVRAITVAFGKSGIVVVWDFGAPSLLSFAKDQGLTPDFRCGAGVCGTCTSRFILGDLHKFEVPL
jgi:ferredoxin